MPALPFEEGMSLRGQRRLAEAIAALGQAVAEEPGHALAWFWLATTLDNTGREAEAIPAYRRALDLDIPPDLRTKALTWLASSLAKIGHPGEAVAPLAQADALGGYLPRAEYEAVAASVRQAILEAEL